MLGIGEAGEQTSSLLQQHNEHLNAKSQNSCLMSSQILIPESLFDLCLKGKGHILFFHNSLLHSNIKFTPSTSWVEDRGLCFKLKPISDDLTTVSRRPHDGKVGRMKNFKGLHNSSEIAPAVKGWLSSACTLPLADPSRGKPLCPLCRVSV